eukprot:TRINITY_DN8521_c0_g1_i2.p1 TRINITY_DN8521_c0_g1~~TRINITY_DN8521_c0_g1_i2.p1  ORF type:complete len:136 (-),score=29.24 TRINITY_DN8521_c0_g1_i2:560-967(-)
MCIRDSFSVGKDKYLFFARLAGGGNANASEEKIFMNELTALLVARERRQLFVADIVGNIFVYGYDEGKVVSFLHTLKAEEPVPIKVLTTDPGTSMLFAGDAQGNVYIFSLGRSNNAKLYSLMTRIPTTVDICTLS